MKAISLIQPWAQLVVLGAKTVETRSWSTMYRGELFIHASGGYIPEGKSLLDQDLLVNYFQTRGLRHEIKSLPSMAIIGKVTLRNVIKAKTFIAQCRELGFDTEELEREYKLGDLSGDRYAWLLDEPVMFDKPIPCKGALSVWRIPDEIWMQILDLPEILKP